MKTNSINVEKVLKELTLDEKAKLCSGYDFWLTEKINRLNIPHIQMADGPHGLRKESPFSLSIALKDSFPATCFPPAVNLASSWSKENVVKVAESIADQAMNQHVSIFLGPGINIKRSPLCGRNFEYFSEDPYLAGQLCADYINAAQKKNIGTSLKHYAVNNQEYRRMTVSAEVDERALREIYLTPFEIAVKKSQPWTIMSSYNRINGTHASDNKKLLTDILRNEWGFKGAVISDWTGTNDRIKSIPAGLDIEMPSSNGISERKIKKAINKGTLKTEDLDRVVRRILELVSKCQDFEVNDALWFEQDTPLYEKAHQTAREVARDSFVLLKNENSALPAKKNKKVLVIGGLAENMRYQGSGSSRIHPFKVTTFLDALKENKVDFEYAKGYITERDEIDAELEAAAIKAAENYDEVFFFLGLTDAQESEGFDRPNIDMPKNQMSLYNQLVKKNKKINAVLFCGAPVETTWAKDAQSLLCAYLPGEAGGYALYDVLFGDYSPSGKLAETFPVKLEDNLAAQYFPMGPATVEHRESIYVGYRYYDTAGKDVAFPFGYGLTYSKFEYSNIQLSTRELTDKDELVVSVDIKNVGNYPASEVVQLYIKKPDSKIYRAYQELKAFDKVFLKPGETKTVTMTLNKRSFAFFDVTLNDWNVENGQYQIRVGASSRNIFFRELVTFTSERGDKIQSLKEQLPSYYNLNNAKSIPNSEFEVVLGREITPNVPPKRGEMDMNTTIEDLQCCAIGKTLAKFALPVVKKAVKDADFTMLLMLEKGFMSMPLRGLSANTKGIMSERLIEGFLDSANKKHFSAFFKILGGSFTAMINGVKIMRQEKKKQKRIKAKMKKIQEGKNK